MTKPKIYEAEDGRKFTLVIVAEPLAGSCIGCAASDPDGFFPPTKLCRELNRECGNNGIFKEIKS